MAFNWQTFKTRTITALLFAALMLLGLFWNHWTFLVLFSVIHFGCWWEYLKLTEKITAGTIPLYSKMGLLLMGYGLFLWFCGPSYHAGGYGLKQNFSLPVSVAGFVLLVAGIFQKKPFSIRATGMGLLGLIYISFSLGLMMDLSGQIKNPDTGESLFTHYNKYLPALIIFSIWINDTMAYIVGSLIGRTPLSRVSPKKTWEGTIGGVLLSGGIAFFLPYFFDIPYIDPSACIVAIAVAIVGTIGDLFESKLKRMAGVKDSGQIMPGHGGFLDRFDSLLFAIPIAWAILQPCYFQC